MSKVLEGGGIKATACRTFGLNILSREDLTSFFGNAAPKASSVSLCCFAICRADRRIAPTVPDRSRRFQ